MTVLAQSVDKYLATQADPHLERARALLRQPSVSSEDRGVPEAGALLADMHREVGFDEVELLPTDRYPLVYAYADAGAPLTLGVYAYYDTNVAGPGWTREPFGAEIGPAGTFARALFGVGVATKASYVAWLNAIEALRKANALPVNIVTLVEGEEWVGSTHVADGINKKRKYFDRAHSVVWPGYSQTAGGEARIALGTKGFLHIKLSVSGRKWGHGPVGAVHGSSQGVLDSPAWHLIDALATMSADGGKRITIEGFGEGIVPPTDEFRAMTKAILDRVGNGKIGDVIPGIDGASKIAGFADDRQGEELLLKYMFTPTLNLSGVAAGYTGPGTWQYGLPAAAFCTIDVRMPPAMDHRQTLQAIRSHLDRKGFADIEIETLASYGSSSSAPHDAVVRAAMACFTERSLEPVVWPRRGSSGPLGIFSDELNVPTLSGFGLGHASQSGPDTFAVLDGSGRVGGFLDTERFFAAFLDEFARQARS